MTLFEIYLTNGEFLDGAQVIAKKYKSLVVDYFGETREIPVSDIREAKLYQPDRKNHRKHSMIFVGQDPYQDYDPLGTK